MTKYFRVQSVKLHVNCALKVSWYYKQCDNTTKCQHQLTGLVFFGVLRVARITFFVGVVVVFFPVVIQEGIPMVTINSEVQISFVYC